MAEHWIRLRGGWECQWRDGPDDDAAEVVRRLDLPLASAGGLPSRFRLTRQFGRPPVDDRLEVVLLELKNVAGLRSVRLNGRPIVPDWADDRDASIRLPGPLLPRNGLVLEFDTTAASPDGSRTWGEIALVIRPR